MIFQSQNGYRATPRPAGVRQTVLGVGPLVSLNSFKQAAMTVSQKILTPSRVVLTNTVRAPVIGLPITGNAIYMATNGNDANSGSITAPVATAARASALATPGDTVILRGGTYTSKFMFTKAGTAAKPIQIQPAAGEAVIFDGASTAAGTDLVEIDVSYITFRGFEVRNSKRIGIASWEAKGLKILNNVVHGCTKQGIWVGGGTAGVSVNNLIDGCTVYDCVRENRNADGTSGALGGGGWGQGITMANSDGTIIQNCTVYEVYGEGIGIQQTIGGKILNSYVTDAFSVMIYLDNAQSAIVQGNQTNSTKTQFYRSGQGRAHGCMISNEFVDRQLPSSNINVTGNNFINSPTQVFYAHFDADTGLVNSVISPNSYT